MFAFRDLWNYLNHMPTQADHIKVSRSPQPYSHHGIYIGAGKVIHYSGDLQNLFNASIRKTSLKEFEDGRDSERVHYDKCLPRNEVVFRASSCLGEKEYNLINNNCEHFATWCKTGNLVSNQITRLETLAEFTPLKPCVYINKILGDLKAISTIHVRRIKIYNALKKKERMVADEEEKKYISLKLGLNAKLATLKDAINKNDIIAKAVSSNLNKIDDKLLHLLTMLNESANILNPETVFLINKINILLSF
jgi:hypothetical protein